MYWLTWKLEFTSYTVADKLIMEAKKKPKEAEEAEETERGREERLEEQQKKWKKRRKNWRKKAIEIKQVSVHRVIGLQPAL